MTVKADKKLGQHFLHDGRVIGRIAAEIARDLHPADALVEIGPGTGALTRPLLEFPNKILLIEKDPRCVAALEEALRPASTEAEPTPDGWRFTHNNRQIQLKNVDALTLDWSDLLQGFQGRAGGRPVVVGNLPYNVGTEIVANLLQSGLNASGPTVKRMVFMLQKEVVQRLCARPGNKNWGRLGVLAHLLSDARLLFNVPPGAFSPPPKVNSSIVELVPLPTPRYPVDMQKLDRLLRLAFGQKRKMLRASLRGALTEETIASLNIDPAARPETLSTEKLCQLATAL